MCHIIRIFFFFEWLQYSGYQLASFPLPEDTEHSCSMGGRLSEKQAVMSTCQTQD